MNRRIFLQTLSTGGIVALTNSYSVNTQPLSSSVTIPVPELIDGSIRLTSSVTLPPPQQSGIEHIVVVMMENRSFDHLLGWVPGADGKQAGLTYLDRNGRPRSTSGLAPDYTGCPHPDPDHSYDQSRVSYDAGAMDGFLRAGANDTYAIGYYSESDLPFYSALARNFLVCDRHFASILGPTFPNRMFLWTGQTDRLDDSVSFSELPTIFDRLDAARVSHRYFFSNLPFLAFWGLKYLFSVGLIDEFMQLAATGKLPAVSFVEPSYTLLDDGTGNDDHPHADVRNGDAFLASIFYALANGPAWKNTVLIITFDEGGGFFDHVAPPRVVAANGIDKDMVGGQVLLGFRTPTIIASPFTRNPGTAPMVSHTVFDHTSVLKLIEWRWNLQPLSRRDASAQIGNFATDMNFSSPNSGVPRLPRPGAVSAAPCFGGILSSTASSEAEIQTAVTNIRSHSPGSALAGSPGVALWRKEGRLPIKMGS
jgi:phospholipase C